MISRIAKFGDRESESEREKERLDWTFIPIVYLTMISSQLVLKSGLYCKFIMPQTSKTLEKKKRYCDS